MTKKQLKVGFYGITGCAGCQLSVLFNEGEILQMLKLVDLVAFPFVKEANKGSVMDYVFVEGLVSSPGDLDTLQKLRASSRYLVAIGACAHTGCVPAYRKFSETENFDRLKYSKDQAISDVEPTPLDSHVKVDYTLPGCPPDKREILGFIAKIASGIRPSHQYSMPVCVECRQNDNLCLLEKSKPCLGPVTAGGCNAVCTNGGLECWGCRGPTDDAEYSVLIKLLESKGISRNVIRQRLRTFAGLKLPAELEKMLE